jgi:hypothetical protein
MSYFLTHNNTIIAKVDYPVFAGWVTPRLPYMLRVMNNIDSMIQSSTLSVGQVYKSNKWQAGTDTDKYTEPIGEVLKSFADLRGLRPEWIEYFLRDYVSTRNFLPRWEAAKSVGVGDLRVYRNQMYKVIQAHTTQANWTPDATPALWGRVAFPGHVAEWSSYDANTLYLIISAGDPVQHNGVTYYCVNPTYSWIEPGSGSSHFGWSLTKPN